MQSQMLTLLANISSGKYYLSVESCRAPHPKNRPNCSFYSNTQITQPTRCCIYELFRLLTEYNHSKSPNTRKIAEGFSAIFVYCCHVKDPEKTGNLEVANIA